MNAIIEANKYVELTYKVVDQKTRQVLTQVEFPLGYVHGVTEILSPRVIEALEGKSEGDVIDVHIDCNDIYGPRDEALVVIEAVENVPEAYREVGTAILMENDNGKTKSFLVTRVDARTVTIDGNNPLCGREVIFKLEIVMVRDATDEEIRHGGKVEAAPDLSNCRAVPV
ncbi:hypothetical protein [Acidiferrobacter sp.]|uniref:FKBP-type peptidyl-prolyl cis-trans isomerase n=1 Tax=Acidiferrobacter sp. TaxID=1872107 RepID=UPI00261EECF7|nr:hypothetical protein [Acidiferrobacter sp.]